MTGVPFGAIVLTDFPFTDLSASKRRLERVVSGDNDRRIDVVVAYITSFPRIEPDAVPIMPTPENGLKVSSLVRFDNWQRWTRRSSPDVRATPIPAGSCDTFFGVFGLP
jgi:hypothetical protein